MKLESKSLFLPIEYFRRFRLFLQLLASRFRRYFDVFCMVFGMVEYHTKHNRGNTAANYLGFCSRILIGPFNRRRTSVEYSHRQSVLVRRRSNKLIL